MCDESLSPNLTRNPPLRRFQSKTLAHRDHALAAGDEHFYSYSKVKWTLIPSFGMWTEVSKQSEDNDMNIRMSRQKKSRGLLMKLLF